MRGFARCSMGMSVAIAMLGATSLFTLAACDTTAKARWTATADGTGSDLTGGGVGFDLTPVTTPAQTPWTVAHSEQLEKGNAGKVAAQVAASRHVVPASKQIMPVPTPAPRASVVATPGGGTEGARSSGAWYNGFLP